MKKGLDVFQNLILTIFRLNSRVVYFENKIKIIMKNFKVIGMIALVLLVGLTACGPKDKTIQENVNKLLAEGMSATVEKGAVTLTGEVKDKLLIPVTESAVKAVKGVKSVNNMVTVMAPEVPEVVIPKVDASLEAKVTDALKDFPGVKYILKDGQIDLSGEVLRAKLVPLMQILQGMGLKVNSTNLVKK